MGEHTTGSLRTAARDLLDVQALRAGQKEAVQAVLDGRDTLAVLPTGWGKSAIYQLAGELLAGPTVVVSPLIALQTDQLRAIGEHDELSAAAALNSTLRAAERREVEEQLADGTLEYLLLAPEQLTRPGTVEQLRAAGVSLFVVDEAHCVSDWGHDFRPDYLRLGAAIEALGHPTVLALTATAAPPVRTEIVERLGLRDPTLVVHGFDRPNIHLAVEHVEDEDRHREAVVAACVRDAAAGPGILYVATRPQAETFARELRVHGLRADHYHGGMDRDGRTRVHAAFQGDELDVVVATPAFGMGIDKPDVRFVHHAHVPDSLDSYHQEVGRAGRDGAPATAILHYRVADLGLRRFLAAGGGPDPATIEALAAAIDGAEGDVDVAWLETRVERSGGPLTRALTALEATGFARLLPDGTVEQLEDGPPAADLAALVVARAEARERYEASRLEMMQAYAETDRCRGRFLLDYYGQHTEERCDHCDRCAAGVEVRVPDEVPFPLQSRVEHAHLGLGTVTRYEDDRVVVVFDDAGYRTLSLAVLADQQLLRPASDPGEANDPDETSEEPAR